MSKEPQGIERILAAFRQHMLLQASAILFAAADERLEGNATHAGAVQDAEALLREIEKKNRP